MGERADTLTAMAKDRAKEKRISYRDALLEITREYPHVFREWQEEIPGRKTRTDRIGNLEVLVISHDPQKQLHEMTVERMSEKGIRYSAALIEICREHPELYEATRKQSLGG